MFDSIFSTRTSAGSIFLMVGLSVAYGFVSAFIASLKLRSGKGYFITVALIPSVVSVSFAFLNVMLKNDTTSAITGIAAIMVGMGLIRFRSAQGKAEEMLMLFVSVVTGALNGLGYVGYAGIFAVALPLLFVGLFSLNVLKNRRLSGEKLLKITIPENLAYSDAFADTFGHYLKEYEQVGVKTTGMGSMFRISYRIVMKDEKEEKEMIDELRIKNGNLEISVLPYVEDAKAL